MHQGACDRSLHYSETAWVYIYIYIYRYEMRYRPALSVIRQVPGSIDMVDRDVIVTNGSLVMAYRGV